MLRSSSRRAPAGRIGENAIRNERRLYITSRECGRAAERACSAIFNGSTAQQPSHSRSISFLPTPKACVEASRMALASFGDAQRGRRRLDKKMADRLWGEIQQQWALNSSKTQEADANVLLDIMRTLSGAREPSTFLASQDVFLDNREYRLSPDEFDLKGKHEAPSLRPIAPASSSDLTAIQSIYDHLMNSELSDGQFQEAIKLRLYACFSLPYPRRASKRLVCELLRTHKHRHLDQGALHMLVNVARMGSNFRLGALLLVLARRRMGGESGPVMTRPVADLCTFLLHSPNHLDRLRSRRMIDGCLAQPNGDAHVNSLPMVMVAGLLDGLVRSDELVIETLAVRRLIVERPTVRRLTSILERMVMESSPNSKDPRLQFCIAALITERALAPVTSFQPGGPQFWPMRQWLATLASRGHLDDDATRATVHAILLRARDRRLDMCETEPGVKACMLELSQQYPDIRSGSTSWGWAMRALMGMSSTLIRPYRTGRRDDRPLEKFVEGSSEPNLLQVHEADALLDTYMQTSRFATPTPFLCLPLLVNLMAQFPPQVERSMAIYRSMRGTGQTSPSLFDRFFAHFRRDPGQDSQSLGADGRVTKVMLNALLQCEPPEVALAKEVVSDVTRSHEQAIYSLTDWDRVRYAAVLLSLLEEDEAVEFWRSLSHAQDAMRPTTWCSDWQSGHWMTLIKHCAGIGKPLGLFYAHTKRRETKNAAQDASRPMRVSLPVLVRVVSSAIRSRQFEEGQFLFATLIHKLGQMATRSLAQDGGRGTSKGSKELPPRSAILRTITYFHETINQGRASEPDLALLNALMDAYGRCRSPSVVFEIWDALAIASLSAHGSSLQDWTSGRVQGVGTHQEAGTSSTHPKDVATIDSITISILLDTAGRCGREDRGRRAWKFVGRLDEDVIKIIKRRLEPEIKDEAERDRLAHLHARPYLIRNTNAWNSWLEFLCRCGCLPEAMEGLEEMKRQGQVQGIEESENDVRPAVQPDAKTIGVLLRFAARNLAKAREQAEAGSGEFDAASASVWTELRERARSGEFGPRIWEKVRDIGADVM